MSPRELPQGTTVLSSTKRDLARESFELGGIWVFWGFLAFFCGFLGCCWGVFCSFWGAFLAGKGVGGGVFLGSGFRSRVLQLLKIFMPKPANLPSL